MAYCTIDNVRRKLSEKTLVELTDPDNQGVADYVAVDDAIADADALIDGYLGFRYPTPLTTVPVLIRSISADIAAYYLSQVRPAMPEEIQKRYGSAVTILEAIRDGRIDIGITPKPLIRCTKTTADRVFTTETLKGY